jgi:hypothetical protein
MMTIAESCRSNRCNQLARPPVHRQTGRDTGEDDDRDAVTQTALSNLLAQPHQEHRSGQQRHDRHEAECIAWIQHQTCLRLQCDCNAAPGTSPAPP